MDWILVLYFFGQGESGRWIEDRSRLRAKSGDVKEITVRANPSRWTRGNQRRRQTRKARPETTTKRTEEGRADKRGGKQDEENEVDGMRIQRGEMEGEERGSEKGHGQKKRLGRGTCEWAEGRAERTQRTHALAHSRVGSNQEEGQGSQDSRDWGEDLWRGTATRCTHMHPHRERAAPAQPAHGWLRLCWIGTCHWAMGDGRRAMGDGRGGSG